MFAPSFHVYGSPVGLDRPVEGLASEVDLDGDLAAEFERLAAKEADKENFAPQHARGAASGKATLFSAGAAGLVRPSGLRVALRDITPPKKKAAAGSATATGKAKPRALAEVTNHATPAAVGSAVKRTIAAPAPRPAAAAFVSFR